MRFRKRALAALLLLFLCLSCGANTAPLFAVPAEAEEEQPNLRIAVTIEPKSLVVPGDATITFTMVNHTTGMLEALCLTSVDGTVVEPIGDLAPAETAVFVRAHSVTQDELDAGTIPYIITCVSGSDHFSYPVSASIVKNAAEPEVEFLRMVSDSYVSDGGSATIVYKVKNVGNVPVRAISISDALGSFERTLDVLDVGESHSFIQYAAAGENVVSAPVLTYSAVSDEQEIYTVQLDGLPLYAAHAALSAEFIAGRSVLASDTAEVILTLTNNGNVDYSDVVVYDDVFGGIVADTVRIPADSAPVQIARTYPLRGDSSYRWRITGKTEAGDSVDFVTETVSVPAEEVSEEISLALSASTTMPRISRKGYIPVRIEVSSLSGAEARNVCITDASGEEVYTFAIVASGEPTVRELRVYVDSDTTLAYSASCPDENGGTYTVSAQPLEITIGRGGQTPETDESVKSLFGGLATQMHNTSLFMVMLVGSCVVLVALIIALCIFSLRARIQRRERNAARRQRIKEELAKTAPFKPIRKNPETKK